MRTSILVLFILASLGGTWPSPVHGDDELIEKRESMYNTIFVSKKENGHIVMSFGRNDRYWTETIYDPSNELVLPSPYTRYMTAGLAYPDKLRSIAEVGFGGGRTAWYLHKHLPEVPITSAELDSEVVDLATKYFGVREEPNFSVVTKDGRLFLTRDKEIYDLIMVDAYRGPFVPFHLLTTEFYRTAKRRLSEGGALVQNIAPSTMLYDAALATLGEVFENLDLYSANNNIVVVAYDGPPKQQSALLQNAEKLQDEHGFFYPLDDLIAQRRVVNRLPEQKPLTDDFAPVDTLKAIERHNNPFDGIAERPGQ